MQSIPLVSPKQTATSDGVRQIDLFGILNTLRRGKWVILTSVLIFALAAGFYVTRMVVPLYTATATVALQSRNQQVVDFNSVVSGLGGDIFTIYTEIEVLRARNLVAQVVDKLNLVEDSDFNPLLAEQKVFSFSITGLMRSAFQSVGLLKRPVEGPPPTREMIREGIITTIQGSLSISNIEYSRAYYLSIATVDPEDAARIVNTLAELYLLDQVAMKYKATEQANIWLMGRVSELRAELETAENALKDFKARMTLASPEALEALNRQMREFRDRVAATEDRALALAAQIADLEAAMATGDTAKIAEIANDRALTQALRLLPAARETFDVRAKGILARIRTELTLARSQLVALKDSLTDLRTRVEAQSQDLLEFQALEREIQATRQIYEYFQTRQKETSVQQGIHVPDARILSPALVPGGPSSPRKTFSVMVAAILGAILGVLLVLLREMRQTGFRSPQDLELATNQRVLAQIPRAPVTKRNRLIRYLVTKTTSALAEAVRNLRTSVMLSNVDHPPQVIMLTSSQPGEGKTTQSLALAQSFASMGRSVLLIEGDVRRRTFQQYFRVRNQVGLIKTILEDIPLEEAVHHSSELGVDILMGEKSTVNAADFFSSTRVQTFLERARAEYDIVIIDTPPVLVVPDARVIGRYADAVLYIVHWNHTSQTQVEEGLKSLANVDVRVSGLVLSQVDARKAAGYGGYYHDLYKGYGGKYYRN